MTIAFGQVFWFVAIKWHAVTGGEDGLLNIPRPPLDLAWSVHFPGRPTSPSTTSFFSSVAHQLMILLLWRLVHSPFGTVLQAIRQNETRARFAGYNVWLVQMDGAFSLSAAIAGLAGGLCSRWRRRAPIRMS